MCPPHCWELSVGALLSTVGIVRTLTCAAHTILDGEAEGWAERGLVEV